MSRKDGIHYSQQEMEMIFREEGFHANDARCLARDLCCYPFTHLDMLYKSIRKIKAGRPEKMK